MVARTPVITYAAEAASHQPGMPLNNDMPLSTAPQSTVRRFQRLPGPDTDATTPQQHDAGWVGVQYYNQLHFGQDDEADEPSSSQTHAESHLVQPPLVQHASVPLHHRRGISLAQDHGDLDQDAIAEKRARKSLVSLFENGTIGGYQRQDASPSPSARSRPQYPQDPAFENVDPCSHYHNQQRQHQHQQRPLQQQYYPQESATLDLLRRGEKRSISTRPSQTHDDADNTSDAPIAKRGRESLHGSSRPTISSPDDQVQQMGNSSQHQQSSSFADVSRTCISRGRTSQHSQVQEPVATNAAAIGPGTFTSANQQASHQHNMPVSPSSRLSIQDTGNRTKIQPVVVNTQEQHGKQGQTQHKQEHAAEQMQHERDNTQSQAEGAQQSGQRTATPLPQEQDQERQEQEVTDEDGAADAVMDIDAAEEADLIIDVEQEKIQNDIRVFERTFPGLQEHFKVLDKIGEGTFSSVYKAIDLKYNEYSNSHWDYGLDKKPYRMCEGRDFKEESTETSGPPGKLVAIKRITVASSPQRIESELSVLRELSGHKNVAPLITAFRHRDQVIVVLPFYEHDEFRTYFRHLPLDDIRWYLRALLSALKHIHKFGIIHRDIKPANFLYDTVRKTGVLVDFGLAQKEDQFQPSQHPSKYRSYVPPVAPSTPAAATAGGVGGVGAALDPTTPAAPHAPSQSHIPGVGGGGVAPADLLRPNKHTNSPQLQQSQQQQPQSLPTAVTALGANREPGFLRRDARPIIRVNRAGTRGFRAPEILFRHVQQTVALDVWAAGVIFSSFLTGRFPFFNAAEDPDALIELTILYGRNEMKKVAATFNRTFVTNVPTVKDDGISFLRLCRVLHPSRFGVPYWFDSKLPIKVVKGSLVKSAAHTRHQLEKLIQLRSQDSGGGSGSGGGQEQEKQKQQASQSQSQGNEPLERPSTSQAAATAPPTQETISTAPTVTAKAPPPSAPLTLDQQALLQEKIIQTKTKFNDICHAHNAITRHQQKYHIPGEQKEQKQPSSTSSQKVASTSQQEVPQGATATTATTPAAVTDPQTAMATQSVNPQQSDQGQQPAEKAAAQEKSAVGVSKNDAQLQNVRQDYIKKPVVTDATNITTPAVAVRPNVNVFAPSQIPEKPKQRLALSVTPFSQQSQQQPQQQQQQQQPDPKVTSLPSPLVDQRKQMAANSNLKASASTSSSSKASGAGVGSNSSNRSHSFGWDSQEGLEDAVDLLQKLLCLDPAKRITAEQALSHKFLATYTPQQLKSYRAFKEEYARQEQERLAKGLKTKEADGTAKEKNGVVPVTDSSAPEQTDTQGHC